MSSSWPTRVVVAVGTQLVHAGLQAGLALATVEPAIELHTGLLALFVGVGVLSVRWTAAPIRPSSGPPAEPDPRYLPDRADAEPTEPASWSDHPTQPALIGDGGVEESNPAGGGETLTRMQDTAAALAGGNLHPRFDEDAADRTIRAIASDLNALLGDFEQTVSTGREFSRDITNSSDQVTAAIDAVREASENFVERLNAIADVFDGQHERIEDVSAEIRELSASVEEIAGSSEEVANLAKDAREETRSGLEDGVQAQQTMEEAAERMAAVRDTVEALDSKADEIGRVVTLIDDIAEQTNILALNANVEAARANSENSEGFAVVAEEVKTLAEETAEATNEIDALISEVRSQTTQTVEEIDQLQEVVLEGRDSVEQSHRSLQTIDEYVAETARNVEEISETVDDQADTTTEISSIAQDVTEVSQENVDEADQLAAIAEEQTLALGEVYVNITSLNTRANQLSTLFDQYDT